MSLYLSLLIFSIQDVGHYHSNQPLFFFSFFRICFLFWVWLHRIYLDLLYKLISGRIGVSNTIFFRIRHIPKSWKLVFSNFTFSRGAETKNSISHYFMAQSTWNLQCLLLISCSSGVAICFLYLCLFFFLKNFLLADNNKFSKNINPKIWRPNFFLS